jgi:hypothetical protein
MFFTYGFLPPNAVCPSFFTTTTTPTSTRDKIVNEIDMQKALADLESAPSAPYTVLAAKYNLIPETISRRWRKITASRAEITEIRCDRRYHMVTSFLINTQNTSYGPRGSLFSESSSACNTEAFDLQQIGWLSKNQQSFGGIANIESIIAASSIYSRESHKYNDFKQYQRCKITRLMTSCFCWIQFSTAHMMINTIGWRYSAQRFCYLVHLAFIHSIIMLN